MFFDFVLAVEVRDAGVLVGRRNGSKYEVINPGGNRRINQGHPLLHLYFIARFKRRAHREYGINIRGRGDQGSQRAASPVI